MTNCKTERSRVAKICLTKDDDDNDVLYIDTVRHFKIKNVY